jgi:hypothetical protein
MLRDNLVGLIEPMQISAGADPLALSIQKRASDDRPSCLENPRPEGVESSLTENVTSPFQAEPTQEGDKLVSPRLSFELGTNHQMNKTNTKSNNTLAPAEIFPEGLFTFSAAIKPRTQPKAKPKIPATIPPTKYPIAPPTRPKNPARLVSILSFDLSAPQQWQTFPANGVSFPQFEQRI